jgi:dynactin complex subunit
MLILKVELQNYQITQHSTNMYLLHIFKVSTQVKFVMKFVQCTLSIFVNIIEIKFFLANAFYSSWPIQVFKNKLCPLSPSHL